MCQLAHGEASPFRIRLKRVVQVFDHSAICDWVPHSDWQIGIGPLRQKVGKTGRLQVVRQQITKILPAVVMGRESSFSGSGGTWGAVPSAAGVAAGRVTWWSCPGS